MLNISRIVYARNIGIDLFKIIACYAVVSIHFGATVPLLDLAVPCFFFLAFYLSPKITNSIVMTIFVFGLSGLMRCVMKRVEMCRAFVK